MIYKILGLVLITPFFAFLVACFRTAYIEVKYNIEIPDKSIPRKICKDLIIIFYAIEFLIIGLYFLFK